MKLIKQLILLIITIMLSVGIASTTYAGGGQAAKRQKQQEAKDAKEQAVKKYKTIDKPAFDTKLASTKAAIKNKKTELKPVIKAFEKQSKETGKLYDDLKASQNKLNSMWDKVIKAKNDLDVNPGNDKQKLKKLKDINDLEKQYWVERKNHFNGPLKNYNDSSKKTQNQKVGLKKLINELDNLRVDKELLVANKMAAKDKAKKTIKVEAVQVPNVNQVVNNSSQNPQNIRNPNRAKVFDVPLANGINPNQAPETNYGNWTGPVIDKKGKNRGFGLLPQPNDPGGLGEFIGGGANSKVYASKGDPKKVNKLVQLTDDDGNIQDFMVRAVKDQAVGKAIVTKLKADYDGEGLSKIFSVAETSQGPQLWTAQGVDKNGKAITHKFVRTREENISSDEVDANGKVLGVASNARERLELRQKADPSVTGLTPREELTINIFLRALNQNGIAWPDHKLENLDVVKDPKSPTGHRVILFDFDAFRPVKGATRADRYKEAREMQKYFDSAESFPDAKTQNFISSKFDNTAFDGEDMGILASPSANRDRLLFNNLNNRTSNEINQVTKLQLPTRDVGDNLDLEPN